VPGIIGVYPHEQTAPQDLLFTIEAEIDISKCAGSDRLEDALDYDEVVSAIQTFVSSSRYALIEKMAADLGHFLKAGFPFLTLSLTIEKPAAIPHATSVSIKVAFPILE